MWVLQKGHSGDGCDLASTCVSMIVCSELGKGEAWKSLQSC